MIEVHQLIKRHGDLEVLKGVSLGVKRGEVAVIVGPSGGGKSTLMRCLNGLERFEGGRISIGGDCLQAQDSEAARALALRSIRRRVGMVFQGFNLFPHRSVLQNVTESPIHVLGLSRAQAEERAEALLRRVGLSDKLHARPSMLSGGQQQRVAIARALAMEPEVILFDEPTSALDPKMTGEVLAVISDLAREGQTMLVVTHALEFARGVAHQVHVMEDGRVVASGPPDAILDRSLHTLTA